MSERDDTGNEASLLSVGWIEESDELAVRIHDELALSILGHDHWRVNLR